MDYNVYHFSFKERCFVMLKATGVTAAIIWLFYRSMWAVVIFPIILFFQAKQEKKAGIEKRKNKLQGEFVNGISVLNSSLQAGLSMENAWREVEKETRFLYGEDSLLYRELKEMNQRVAHNIPIEKLFLEFAYKCKVEDIIQFAEILDYGKRSGSNWKRIIETTVNRIQERYDAQKQIEVMVAEKKMEQQIMNIMPLGMIAFLQLSAGDYMAVLYHNWFGIIAMTVFLFLYIVAIIISQRILKVEV